MNEMEFTAAQLSALEQAERELDEMDEESEGRLLSQGFGMGPDTYKGRYQKADRSGSDCWHGVRSLPWRNTAEEAQADLDTMAKRKGWQEWR